MRPLRMGIIGCGYWGPNYIRAFNEASSGTVDAICDIDSARLKPLKSTYPYLNTTTDYHELLENPRIDAICVSTPASTHYAIVKDSLLQGKHVLVEKPLALNVSDSSKLVKLSEEANRVLMVGHVYLYHPAVSKIKQYLSDGDFGELYYMYSIRTGLGPIRKDTNVMWDLAPHDVSIFIYLLDQLPLKVSAVGGSYLQRGIEDVVLLSMEFPKKRIGYVHVSWLDPHKLRRLTLVGRDKMILFEDTNSSEKLKVFNQGVSSSETGSYGEFLLQVSSGDAFIPRVDSTEPLKNQCLAFLEAITRKSVPAADGKEGVQVVRVLEAAGKSLKRGGSPVDL